MKIMKAILTVAMCGASLIASANGKTDFTTSPDYPDVRYSVDQCLTSGGTFQISGWFLPGENRSAGNLKVILNDNGVEREVPLKRRARNDIPEGLLSDKNVPAGFYGSLALSPRPQSFNANIKIIETTGGYERVINHSCNSLRYQHAI